MEMDQSLEAQNRFYELYTSCNFNYQRIEYIKCTFTDNPDFKITANTAVLVLSKFSFDKDRMAVFDPLINNLVAKLDGQSVFRILKVIIFDQEKIAAYYKLKRHFAGLYSLEDINSICNTFSNGLLRANVYTELYPPINEKMNLAKFLTIIPTFETYLDTYIDVIGVLAKKGSLDITDAKDCKPKLNEVFKKLQNKTKLEAVIKITLDES
jgi:hypothetical protein